LDAGRSPAYTVRSTTIRQTVGGYRVDEVDDFLTRCATAVPLFGGSRSSRADSTSVPPDSLPRLQDLVLQSDLDTVRVPSRRWKGYSIATGFVGICISAVSGSSILQIDHTATDIHLTNAQDFVAITAFVVGFGGALVAIGWGWFYGRGPPSSFPMTV
jgi:DivIVA domain-containing protein